MSVAARATGLGGGLRPVGVCAVENSLNDKSPGVGYNIQTDILSQGTLDARGVKVLATPVTVVLEKEHLKKNVNQCNTGDASGQRGQVNFDGKNGNGGQKCHDPTQAPDTDQSYVESFRDGYHGQVNSFVAQDSGNDFNTAQACLDRLITTSQRVWLPVYTNYDKSRKSYEVIGFIEVEFEGYCLQNGSAYNDGGGSTPCKYPVVDSEWFRVKVYGSFTPTTFPSAPPLTSDAQVSQSFICAYEDGSSILQGQCTSPAGSVAGPPAVPPIVPGLTITVSACGDDHKCRFTVSGGAVGATYLWSYPAPSGTTGNPVDLQFPLPSATNGTESHTVTVTESTGATQTVVVACARNGKSTKATCAKSS